MSTSSSVDDAVELDVDLDLEPPCESKGHGVDTLYSPREGVNVRGHRDGGSAAWRETIKCPWCKVNSVTLVCKERRWQLLHAARTDGKTYCNFCSMSAPTRYWRPAYEKI
jgi:hypothetical protein